MTKRTTKKATRTKAARRDVTTGGIVTLNADNVHPHPSNPRERLTGEAFDRLVASLEQYGQLEPVLVRDLVADYVPRKATATPQFELVAGHRRHAALVKLGEKAIDARVVTCDAATAAAIVATENDKHEQLDAIEQARALELLTRPVADGGAGLKQAEAGEQFGKSQAWAANTLRLLKLPANVIDLVRKGELDVTKARALVPYAAAPRVLTAILGEIDDNSWEYETRDEVEQGVPTCAAAFSRPIGGKSTAWVGSPFNERATCQFDVDKLTTEQVADLAIAKIPVNVQGKRVVERRATNVKAWDKLQAAAMPAPKTGKASKTPAKVDADGKARKPTAAEARQATAERSNELAGKVKAWRVRFVRFVASRHVKADDWRTFKLALVTLASTPTSWLNAILAEVLGLKPADLDDRWDEGDKSRTWRLLGRLVEPPAFGHQLAEVVAHLLYPGCGVAWREVHLNAALRGDVIEGLVADYELDLGVEWRKAAAGVRGDDGRGLVEQYFILHTAAELAAIARADNLEPGKTKAATVKILLGRHKSGGGVVPSILKPARKSPAKKGKVAKKTPVTRKGGGAAATAKKAKRKKAAYFIAPFHP